MGISLFVVVIDGLPSGGYLSRVPVVRSQEVMQVVIFITAHSVFTLVHEKCRYLFDAFDNSGWMDYYTQWQC